jgi:hypothetical protein
MCNSCIKLFVGCLPNIEKNLRDYLLEIERAEKKMGFSREILLDNG